MAKELLFLQIGASIQVNGWTINSTARAKKLGMMEQSMKAGTLRERKMDLENCSLRMAVPTRASLKWARSLAQENTYGRMGKNTRVNGRITR